MARSNEITPNTPVKLTLQMTLILAGGLLTAGFGAGKWINTNSKELEKLNTKFEEFEQKHQTGGGCTAEECVKWIERIKATGFLDDSKDK